MDERHIEEEGRFIGTLVHCTLKSLKAKYDDKVK